MKKYVYATFEALVDALLPSKESSLSANDLKIQDYLIYSLNNFISIQKQLEIQLIPLAHPTAEMLNSAANQFISAGLLQPLKDSPFPEGGMFSNLSRKDRIWTLAALEKLYIDLYLLPGPFKNNGGMVKFMTDALNRLSMFGYYSEWPAYGTTRSNPPGYRKLEFFPPGWQQVGYPGVSLGYRDYRGVLFSMQEVKA